MGYGHILELVPIFTVTGFNLPLYDLKQNTTALARDIYTA